jgi:nucleotide-binding universal stress UspA family protein
MRSRDQLLTLRLGDKEMIRTLQARPPTLPDPKRISLARRQGQLGDLSSPSQTPVSKRRVRVLREVLVPLDGSLSAEHALPWAIRIAESAKAQIQLVQVHERMDDGFHGRRANSYRAFDNLLREPKEQYLSDVVNRMTRAGARIVKPMLLEGRGIAETLGELTASADMTVMATRRRSRLGRLLFGSVSQTVLRNASKPLLLVSGYNYPVDLTGRPHLNHALVPLDGSPGSEEILLPIVGLSRVMDGQQTLLRVIPEDRPFSLLKKLPRALADLNDVAKRWKAYLPKLKSTHVWSDSQINREVLKQAEEQQADFIAVAARGGNFSRLFRPGLADYLIRHATMPLLVVKQRSE